MNDMPSTLPIDKLNDLDEAADHIEELRAVIVELIAESVATHFILDKGYKPAIEKAVLMLGLSKPHGSNQLNIDLTEALENKP